jgi:hypothetical protein
VLEASELSRRLGRLVLLSEVGLLAAAGPEPG